MLRHAVLFRWRPEVTAEDVAAITEALRQLPAVIPELRDYQVGSDVGTDDGNWDFAVVAVFDNEAARQAYVRHPEHQAVALRIRAFAAARAAVQFES
ncbi:MAG: Dabb family protein [Acidimicrobiales bacterium]